MGRKRIITYKGRSMSMIDWCRETGVAYGTASERIRRGAPDVQAVGLEPYRKKWNAGRKAGRVSLCLSCRNARADKCVWVWRGVPVKGWEAEKDLIKSHNKLDKPVETWRVIRCPHFKEDERL